MALGGIPLVQGVQDCRHVLNPQAKVPGAGGLAHCGEPRGWRRLFPHGLIAARVLQKHAGISAARPVLGKVAVVLPGSSQPVAEQDDRSGLTTFHEGHFHRDAAISTGIAHQQVLALDILMGWKCQGIVPGSRTAGDSCSEEREEESGELPSRNSHACLKPKALKKSRRTLETPAHRGGSSRLGWSRRLRGHLVHQGKHLPAVPRAAVIDPQFLDEGFSGVVRSQAKPLGYEMDSLDEGCKRLPAICPTEQVSIPRLAAASGLKDSQHRQQTVVQIVQFGGKHKLGREFLDGAGMRAQKLFHRRGAGILCKILVDKSPAGQPVAPHGCARGGSSRTCRTRCAIRIALDSGLDGAFLAAGATGSPQQHPEHRNRSQAPRDTDGLHPDSLPIPGVPVPRGVRPGDSGSRQEGTTNWRCRWAFSALPLEHVGDATQHGALSRPLPAHRRRVGKHPISKPGEGQALQVDHTGSTECRQEQSFAPENH